MTTKSFVCDVCGYPLDLFSESYDEGAITTFTIIPCEVCLRREYEVGYSDGEDSGYKLGYTDCEESRDE